MTKVYITWQTFWISRTEGRHIDANIKLNWNYETNPITIETLGYGNIESDKRHLAILDIPESYDVDVVDRFYRSLDVFAIAPITPQKALTLCNEWYVDAPLIEGKTTPFELDTDGFTLIDNRYFEDMYSDGTLSSE